MKKLLFNLIMLTSFSVFSQEKLIRYADVQSMDRNETGYTSYTAKDGRVYKIGDKVKLGVPMGNGRTFTFIQMLAALSVSPVDAVHAGEEVSIKKMYLQGNRNGRYLCMMTTSNTGLASYVIIFENALENKELKGLGMTSEEALAELKKAKDKLDLGIISQPQFDSIKSEMVKFIH